MGDPRLRTMSKALPIAFAVILSSHFVSPGADLAPNSQQSASVRYTSKDGTLRIEGRSPLHDFVVKGREIHGFIDAPLHFPDRPCQISGTSEEVIIAEVVVPVRSLKSIGHDGAHYSEHFDEIMYEKLGEQTQPAIHFQLRSLRRVDGEPKRNLFTLTGQLAVGGRTNRIESPVTITRIPGSQLRITGDVAIDPCDFSTPLLVTDGPVGRLRVQLIFDWTVEKTKVR